MLRSLPNTFVAPCPTPTPFFVPFRALDQIVHGHDLAIVARGEEHALVDHVGEFGAGESRRDSGDRVARRARPLLHGNVAEVHAENLRASRKVRRSHEHASGESSRAEWRGVQGLRAVRRGEH